MKLNVSLLKDISDDVDFCFKLAKEESVILLPGDKHTDYNSCKMHLKILQLAYKYVYVIGFCRTNSGS